MNELISIIVPVYKVEKYLRKCVDSICNQTYRNMEIILVDDGSPDNCGAICDEYARADSRVRVIHKANGGLSNARNAGLDIMTGDYVAFVDSDDWIEPDMYAKLMKNMEHFRADISIGGVAEEIERGGNVTTVKVTSYGEKPFAENETDAMKRYFLGSWAAWDKLYRASLFSEIRFPVGEINEDEAIAVYLLEKCSIVCYSGDIYYHYIKHENSGSITMTPFSKKKIVWYDHCKNNLEFVSAHYPELIPYAKRRFYLSLIWILNNMTADVKQFSDLIPLYRAELKKVVKESNWDYKFSKKEKIRAYLLAYCYYPYAGVVRLLGKHYT